MRLGAGQRRAVGGDRRIDEVAIGHNARLPLPEGGRNRYRSGFAAGMSGQVALLGDLIGQGLDLLIGVLPRQRLDAVQRPGSPVVASVVIAALRTSGCGSAASHISHFAASTLASRGTAMGKLFAGRHVGAEQLPGELQIDFAEAAPQQLAAGSRPLGFRVGPQPPHEFEHVHRFERIERIARHCILYGDRQSDRPRRPRLRGG